MAEGSLWLGRLSSTRSERPHLFLLFQTAFRKGLLFLLMGIGKLLYNCKTLVMAANERLVARLFLP